MKLFDDEFQKWVDEHRNEDIARLRLRYAGAGEEIKEAISQIEYGRKSADKFGDATLWFPTALSVEQASSAAVARFHASLVKEGSRVLDMTMGLGVDAAAIAELDKARVTAIERDGRLCRFAEINYREIKGLHVIHADSVEWMKSTQETFDYIFIDPARRDNMGHRVYNIHDCTPDVAQLLPLMLDHAPKVIVKLSPMLDISATITDLRHVATVYIVEDRGEVRELLAVIDRTVDYSVDNIPVETVNGERSFSFTRAEEASAVERYEIPRAADYLYEPSPAVMKAAPFKLLCERFDVGALHSNTHLYVSPHKIANFPGKRYRIDAVIPYASKHIKRFAKEYPAVSVSVRNFPIAAAALKAKLKVKEGDVVKLFGVTLKGGEQALIVMHRE